PVRLRRSNQGPAKALMEKAQACGSTPLPEARVSLLHASVARAVTSEPQGSSDARAQQRDSRSSQCRVDPPRRPLRFRPPIASARRRPPTARAGGLRLEAERAVRPVGRPRRSAVEAVATAALFSVRNQKGGSRWSVSICFQQTSSTASASVEPTGTTPAGDT